MSINIFYLKKYQGSWKYVLIHSSSYSICLQWSGQKVQLGINPLALYFMFLILLVNLTFCLVLLQKEKIQVIKVQGLLTPFLPYPLPLPTPPFPLPNSPPPPPSSLPTLHSSQSHPFQQNPPYKKAKILGL